MNKNVFWLGNFRDKNIFYDRKTGELYSIDKKEEKAPNLTWAILPVSFLLRNIYSEATAPQVASVPIRIFILCSTVLCVLVLIIFVLRNIRKGTMKSFNQKLYFDWPNFLYNQQTQCKGILFFGTILFFTSIKFIIDYYFSGSFLYFMGIIGFLPASGLMLIGNRPLEKLIILKRLEKQLK